jgi:hypothetical protein
MSGDGRVPAPADAEGSPRHSARGRIVTGSSVRRAAASVGEIRIPDFLLFALLAGAGGLPVQSVGPIPVSHLVGALICAWALTRRPTWDLGRWQLLVPLFVVGLAYVGGLSMFADHSAEAADWKTRLLRMIVVTVILFVLASGRIDMRSALLGMFAVLVLNVPLFYAGLVPDTYGGYLTGIIGDKNVAGLTYCVVGLLMLWAVTSRPLQVLIVAFSASGVWLTGSRTAIAAFVAGVVWVLAAPHVRMVGRWILGVAIAVGVQLASEDYSRIGVFSSREGSDILRARIDAASWQKAQEAGFFGDGLGEAYVNLADGNWFFHNSYWTALVEGGWPWLLLIVAATVLVTVRPFAGAVPFSQSVAQAGGVAILICATRLGEVFYTSIWAIALGFALQMLAVPREGSSPEHGPQELGVQTHGLCEYGLREHRAGRGR